MFRKIPITISRMFLKPDVAMTSDADEAFFSAKLDRLAIGTILRSKLVFLVNVRLRIAFIEGACL